jgi:hypothetical protein
MRLQLLNGATSADHRDRVAGSNPIGRCGLDRSAGEHGTPVIPPAPGLRVDHA